MHCRGQRSCRCQLGSNKVHLLSNAMWPPNSVGRAPDSILGVEGHEGVSWGKEGVNLVSNTLWPSNLVGRTPDQSVMHCQDQMSCRGQPGSTRGQIAKKCCMTIKFGRKNPWSKRNSMLASKVMEGHPGSPEVKYLKNSLWPLRLVEKNRAKCNAVMGSKGLAGVNWGQPEVKCHMAIRFERLSDQSVMHCWGHRSGRCQSGSNKRSIC